tara:strand:- start:12645 stop:12803 length:159 start_codon:yes stop_codon:yes gene_type:complete
MSKYIIEAEIVRREQIEIEADTRKQAVEIARQTDGPKWECFEEGKRTLVSIS